jgi:hypothetical protein
VIEENAEQAETQRQAFEFMIARFCCVTLGFGRVQSGFYPTYLLFNQRAPFFRVRFGQNDIDMATNGVFAVFRR